MDGEKFFYANSVEVVLSQFDVSFNFLRKGTPRGATPGQPVVPETLDKLVVSMSPQHAKSVAAILFQSVMEYEKKFGQIPGDDTEKQKFEKAFGSLLAKR